VVVLLTGNLHKWAFVPRGCAVLWVHPDYQRDIFPVVTSNYSASDFDYNFSYQGTDDNSQYYTAKTALQFSQDIGGHVSQRSTALPLYACVINNVNQDAVCLTDAGRRESKKQDT